MNNQTVCDVNNIEIKEGALIVYAVRDGSCMAALRRGIVVGVCIQQRVDGATKYFIDVLPCASPRRVTLKYPDRIAVIA